MPLKDLDPSSTLENKDPGALENNEVTISSDSSTQTDKRQVTGIRWVLICVSIFSANLLYGLDNTIVADIQADISEAFGNVVDLGWLGSGFCLGCTVSSFPVGRAYSLFDTKWIYIGSLIMFAAGSALCGAAPTMNAMIVGRVWAGAGGAGMYLGTLNLFTALCLPSEQPVFVGMIALVYGSGAIVGPIVGGLFADSPATWRWAFYINPAIVGALLPLCIYALPSIPRSKELSVRMKLRAFDWFGTFLAGAMYFFFSFGLSMGGARWAWSDAATIGCLVSFGVSLVVFILSQYWCVFTTRANRLFPGQFFRNGQMVLLFICTACGICPIFVSIYYIPLYFLFVHGESGTLAAIRMLPFVCVYIASVLACGIIMRRTGYPIMWYLFSGVFLTLGGALWSTVHDNTAVSTTYGYSVLLGLGMATTQAGYSLGPKLASSSDFPNVINFLNVAQQSSQLIGLVVASAIFQNLTFRDLKRVLSGTDFSDADIQGAMAGARSQVLENVGPELRQKCIRAIVRTLEKEWYIVVACGGIYIICSVFMKRDR
ncbi:major facilitator superfamily domain-containing protein, partial [Ilyonectria sp. MPI-CAGE-AT-0026]